MRRLVLIRHGESEWNLERRIQGQSGTGLSERGLEQVRRTSEALAPVYPEAYLATSDLTRCRITAEAFAAVLGTEPVVEPGLRERHFGAWTGRLVRDVAAEDRDRWDRWRRGEDVVAEVGGEDTPTLVTRVVEAYRRTLARAAGAPVICITHGGSIYHGVHDLLGVGDAFLGGVANCSITEVRVGGERTLLESWNQVTHLPPRLRVLGDVPDEERQGGRGEGGSPAPAARQEPGD